MLSVSDFSSLRYMEFSYASVTNVVATSPSSPPPSQSPTTLSSPLSLNSNGNRSSSNFNSTTNVAPLIVSPCAACKILRRRCVDQCVLAPYFPPTEPAKFTTAHRVFGASNIIKLLQDLPESRRADAVSSMVYEAGARIWDPVYGCAGTIFQLQKQVGDLQAQLAKFQDELLNTRTQQANLMALLCVEMANYPPVMAPQFLDNSFIPTPDDFFLSNGLSFLDDTGLASGGSYWEPLWT